MLRKMFSFFWKKDKKFFVNILNTDKDIIVKKEEKLLTAAIEKGIEWPHYCRVGSCGTCRCKLIKGKVRHLTDFGYVLDKDLINEGYILACQSVLKSDIEVELNFKQKAIRRK